MQTSTGQFDGDAENFEAQTKGTARRRVDAYHEVLRERAAMLELDQPYLEVRAWPPRRY